MYYSASDSYYLWDRDSMAKAGLGGEIDIGTDYDQNALIKVQAGGLQNALKELASKTASLGKRSHLEIHCHGLPAELVLGGLKGVTIRTVESFGVALRVALRQGGLIECLACKVASQTKSDGNWDAMLRAPESQIAGYREDYHGAIRLRKTRKYYNGPTPGPTLNPTDAHPWDQRLQAYGRDYFNRTQPIADDPRFSFRPDPDRDGLKFCLALANTTGCVVRAAVTTQWEEASDTDSPVGNWENEVFDFFPDGVVRFLGASPYRGPLLNSFDMDRLGTA